MGDADVDVVVQADADYAVIVRVERPGRIVAQHGAERIDKRFPEVSPVTARPGRHGDAHADRAGLAGGCLQRKPVVRPLPPALRT
jgi:hypothetical protein